MLVFQCLALLCSLENSLAFQNLGFSKALRGKPQLFLSDDNNSKGPRFSTIGKDMGNSGVTKETVNGMPAPDPLPVYNSVWKTPAGVLCDAKECVEDDDTHILPHKGRSRKRVLVLCTGGTLTMSNDPTKGNSLAPVQGALTSYMSTMRELTDDPEMPEIVAHEYKPLIDSSDMGPGDWEVLAKDIAANYFYFDGFVVLMGTDTLCYAASALTFMFQNLGKPVVFTGKNGLDL